MIHARYKIAVVGAGNVGATAAQRLAEKELGDVTLIDIVEGLPQGKALDLLQSGAVEGYGSKLRGSNKTEDVAGSDLVIVTAGLPRKPGMTRDDLLKKNAEIVGGVAEKIRAAASEAIVIVVSNPLDVMTYLMEKITGFGAKRVFGMAGVLDSARLATFIAMELGVTVKDVRAMVLGGHGDTMVPVSRYSTVSGIPVTELLPKERLDAIFQRTRNGGAEIVELLKQGSAYYAPSAAVVQMAEAVLLDDKRVLPVCTRVDGPYGLRSSWVGVPALLGRGGVEKVYDLPLDPPDRAALAKSAEHVAETIRALDAILAASKGASA